MTKWAKENQVLIAVDEVQAGFGRTGELFGFQHYNMEPDIVCMGKAISSSLPFGQLLFAFGFLFIIMGAVLYAIQKWGRKFTGLENEATIKIIARNHIDTKNSLVVARVYEEEVLLGVGANGITLLSRFSPIGEDEIEANNNDNNDSIFDSELKSAIIKDSVSSEELTTI